MTSTFHIRDKNTGAFYKEIDYGYGPNYATTPVTLVHTNKGFGKAFKDMAKLKMHLLYLVGIFMPPDHIFDKKSQLRKLYKMPEWRGSKRVDPEQTPEYLDLKREVDIWEIMHPGYDNVPEWLTNNKPISQVPQEWEVVEVLDKKNKIMNKVDFDPHAYVDESVRLRKLTDAHGSAVRDVYKKLDKAGKLKDFAYVVAVQINPKNVDDWTDTPTVSVKPVDEAVAGMKLKRSELVRTSKSDSIALAFRGQETATWFIMNYFGEDHVVLLDISNLTQLVTPERMPVKDINNG